MMAGRVYTKSAKPRRRAAPKQVAPTTVTGRRVKRLKVSKPAKIANPEPAAKPEKVVKALKATTDKKPAKTAKPSSSVARRAPSTVAPKTPKSQPVQSTE